MIDTKSPTGSRVEDLPVMVSTVIFALREGRLSLPLVRRTRAPFKGSWALPGGPVPVDEGLAEAAARTLAEATGLRPSYLEQLYTFGLPGRSPTGRVISVVYWALVRGEEVAAAADVENVEWFGVDDRPSLAFDHDEIVGYALDRLRTKLEWAQVALFFLPETFTLTQLREVYEVILGRHLDPANFRRQIEASGTIVPTARHVTGGRHRPPRLYRSCLEARALASGPPS